MLGVAVQDHAGVLFVIDQQVVGALPADAASPEEKGGHMNYAQEPATGAVRRNERSLKIMKIA